MAKDMFSQWLENDASADEAFFQENFIIEVYEVIQDEMNQQGVSRSELSEKIGKSKAYISQVLGGSRNMTLRTLADFCKALNVYPEFKVSKHKKEECRHFEYEDVSQYFAEAGNGHKETVSSRPKMRVAAIESYGEAA